MPDGMKCFNLSIHFSLPPGHSRDSCPGFIWTASDGFGIIGFCRVLLNNQREILICFRFLAILQAK